MAISSRHRRRRRSRCRPRRSSCRCCRQFRQLDRHGRRGGQYTPDFVGSKNSKLMPIPIFSIRRAGSVDQFRGPRDNARVDEELAELDRDVRDVRESMTDGGPMDPEDRAAAMIQIEELEAIEGGCSSGGTRS